jgi:hypothetical protein
MDSPLILSLDAHGVPHRWISWQQACFYYAKNLVAWTLGERTFTFYGGHDPEDYQHAVGDPPTDLALHKHSPGYRLILNNVLFPAAEKKEKKT